MNGHEQPACRLAIKRFFNSCYTLLVWPIKPDYVDIEEALVTHYSIRQFDPLIVSNDTTLRH